MTNTNNCPLAHLCKFFDLQNACYQKEGRDYECCNHFIKAEIEMKGFAEYVAKRNQKK
jgi:hypothetical protein